MKWRTKLALRLKGSLQCCKPFLFFLPAHESHIWSSSYRGCTDADSLHFCTMPLPALEALICQICTCALYESMNNVLKHCTWATYTEQACLKNRDLHGKRLTPTGKAAFWVQLSHSTSKDLPCKELVQLFLLLCCQLLSFCCFASCRLCLPNLLSQVSELLLNVLWGLWTSCLLLLNFRCCSIAVFSC